MSVRILICLLAFALCIAPNAFAGRTDLDLADGWRSSCVSEDAPDKPLILENVSVPHNWDGYRGIRWQGHGNMHGTATYARDFVCRPESGRRAFLVFEGVGTYLGVKVNGREICHHRPAGKVVTTLDVTDALSPNGTNELEVICEHPSEISDMPWICSGCSDSRCEGPEPIGLFRMVRLMTTDEVRIEPFGVFVWSRDPLEEVHVETEIRNAGDSKAVRTVRIECPALDIGGKTVVTLEPGETKTVKSTYPLRNFRRWSAEEPNLYRFDVALLKDGSVTDAESVETGFRTVSWPFRRATKDRRLFVNGNPVFIHGVSETDHLFGASQCFGIEEIDARAKLVKETLGFNAIRDGHEPHDLRWGRNWDRLGVYWWPQFGTHCAFDNKAFLDNYRMLFKQWMKERRNSPSVVLWGIQNECVLDADFVREMTRFVHEYDPSSSLTDRLTTCCNYGDGADWLVVQNWSGTYGGDIEKYGEELATDLQLLNGEYGAWRHYGFREKLPPVFDAKGKWSEDHAAYILHRKLVQAWKKRDKLCGHYQWLLFSLEDPGRAGFVDDGYRRIDKAGPLNNKGLFTLWGAPTACYYLYRAYGDALKFDRMDEVIDLGLDEMIARGYALDCPRKDLPGVSLGGEKGRVYLYRLNCGGDEAVDAFGQKWLADSTFFTTSWSMDPAFAADKLNPILCSQGIVGEGVANAADGDQAVLSSYRWGREKLKFTFAVAPLSRYWIEAWFVEPGGYGRQFDVAVNGGVVERKMDLAGQAGPRGAVKRTWVCESDAEGRLVVSFPRVQVAQAVVSALAVSADSETANRTMPRQGLGYPANAGKTWAELGAEVVDRMPDAEVPSYTPPSRPVRPIIRPSSWMVSCFSLPKSNPYVARFTVKKSTAPRDVWWIMVTVAGKRLIAEGGFKVPETSEPVTIDVPVEGFVNAGQYQIFVQSPDGTHVEASEMIEKGLAKRSEK